MFPGDSRYATGMKANSTQTNSFSPQGLKVMLISDAPGTTATPRAHLVNMAGIGESTAVFLGAQKRFR